MIIAIGDLHLADSRPWSEKVSYEIVDYIISLPYNSPDNSLVLLGDLTDKSKVDGSVIEMLRRLFYGLKFKETHIVMGNHEGELSNGKVSLTYDFVENLPDLKTKVFIHRTVKQVRIEEQFCLMLPHVYSLNEEGIYAYNKLPEQFSIATYDFMFGHLTDNRCTFPSTEKVDISYLNTRYNILGHIHAGDMALGYLGSVIPNSVSENSFERNIAVIKDGVLTYEPVPSNILEYAEITYPEPMFRCKAHTVVWTVNNAQDPDLIRSHYGRPNMFIRKCIYESNIDSEKFKEIVSSNETEKGMEFFLEDWFKTKDVSMVLKEKIRAYAKAG